MSLEEYNRELKRIGDLLLEAIFEPSPEPPETDRPAAVPTVSTEAPERQSQSGSGACADGSAATSGGPVRA